jgi:hypothetical protein
MKPISIANWQTRTSTKIRRAAALCVAQMLTIHGLLLADSYSVSIVPE